MKDDVSPNEMKRKRHQFFETAISKSKKMQREADSGSKPKFNKFSLHESINEKGSDSDGSLSTLSSARSQEKINKSWTSKTRHVDPGPYQPMHTMRITKTVIEDEQRCEKRDELQNGWKL
jgi:hypothetical protein